VGTPALGARSGSGNGSRIHPSVVAASWSACDRWGGSHESRFRRGPLPHFLVGTPTPARHRERDCRAASCGEARRSLYICDGDHASNEPTRLLLQRGFVFSRKLLQQQEIVG